MQTRDIRDILGGLVLVILGLWAAWHSSQNYNLGILRSMGPGMFPMGVSALLGILGATIAIPAFFRSGPRMQVDLHGAFFVLSGVASFALLTPYLGLMPAIISTVIVSSLAAPNFRLLTVLLLATALCVVSWLIFRVGLGLSLVMIRSPF